MLMFPQHDVYTYYLELDKILLVLCVSLVDFIMLSTGITFVKKAAEYGDHHHYPLLLLHPGSIRPY